MSYKAIETDDYIIINAPAEIWEAVAKGTVVTLKRDGGKSILLLNKQESVDTIEKYIEKEIEGSENKVIDLSEAKKRLRGNMWEA